MENGKEQCIDSLVCKAFANCRRKGISNDSLVKAMAKYGVSSFDVMTTSQKKSYLQDLKRM